MFKFFYWKVLHYLMSLVFYFSVFNQCRNELWKYFVTMVTTSTSFSVYDYHVYSWNSNVHLWLFEVKSPKRRWVWKETRIFMSSLLLFFFFTRRRFLYMVNLEAPSEPPRKIGRQSKWDVGTVQWNPHKSESHVFAASVSSAVNCDKKVLYVQKIWSWKKLFLFRVTNAWICTRGGTDVERCTPPCRDTPGSSGTSSG